MPPRGRGGRPMLTLTGHTGTVRCLAYSADGRWLASGAEDGTVRLWDLARRESARVWSDQSDSVEAVAFSPVGSRLYAGRADGLLVELHPTMARPRWQEPAHPGGVKCVLAHPGGHLVFSAGWDKQVRSWSVGRPERTPVFPALEDSIAAAALSPDGKTLAVGLNHTYKVHLFDADQGRMHDSLMCDDGTVFSLAFSPTGLRLAAGDTRGRTALWVPGHPQPPRFLEGHRGIVYGLGFTPDDRRLVTSGEDRRARIWEPSTGRLVQEYQWHQGWVTCLAVSPDGLTVATGGEDRVIALWDLPE